MPLRNNDLCETVLWDIPRSSCNSIQSERKKRDQHWDIVIVLRHVCVAGKTNDTAEENRPEPNKWNGVLFVLVCAMRRRVRVD